MNNSKNKFNHSQQVTKEIPSIVVTNLQEIIKERGVHKNIETNMLLQEDLGLTSLDMISLITELCDQLEVDITLLSDVDLARMRIVEDIITILISKKTRNH